MKLLNNHYFSTLSCYNTRLLDSLQAKFLRLPSRSRPFILPCSCKFSVCPKNKVSVFRFMKKTCIFLYFFLSQKRCKECALAHSGVSRGRLRHVSASCECASSRSVLYVTVHAYVPSNGICRGFAFKYGKFLLPPRFLTALSVPKVPTREQPLSFMIP